MCDRNKPIYQLTSQTVCNLIDTLDNNGQQFLGSALSFGEHPFIVMDVERYIPAGKHSISVSKGVRNTTKVINVYELQNGQWLYSTPVYKIRKVNGTTQRSQKDDSFVYPKNALAVYQITVQWEDSLSLEGLKLGIVKYVQNCF